MTRSLALVLSWKQSKSIVELRKEIWNPGHYSFFVSSTTHFLELSGVGETFGEEKDFRSKFLVLGRRSVRFDSIFGNYHEGLRVETLEPKG